jgi:hypothetical protein
MIINVLYMIDSIPNAMVNPIYMLAIGGLSGLLCRRKKAVVVVRVRRGRVVMARGMSSDAPASNESFWLRH